MSNPYMVSPLQGFATGFAQSLIAKRQQDKADALKQQSLTLQYGTKAQQEQDRQQAQQDRENNYKSLDRQRRISEYMQRTQSGEFDNLTDDEIKARTGIDPKNPFGDSPVVSPNGSGNLGTSPQPPPNTTIPIMMGDHGSGDLGTPPNTPPLYAPGQLGSSANPVDARPVPIPQGNPMVPSGPGLPQTPPPAAQPWYPQGPPPNALQALSARGIGPGGVPGYSPTNKFQMPNPTANGPSPAPQPFGAAPSQGNLTPSDMQTPPGAGGWQGAPQQSVGAPPALRPLTPLGPSLTGLRPITYPAGFDPLQAAKSQLEQDNADMADAQAKLTSGLLRSAAGRKTQQDRYDKAIADRDKQQDNIRQEWTRQQTGVNEYDKASRNAAGLLLPADQLLGVANRERGLGIDAGADIPMRQIDRGLSQDAWKRVDSAAQDAIDADPEHWQDKMYNGKPFSFYYDPNGNRLNVPQEAASQMATAGLAKTNAQTDLDTARTDNVKALTDWTKQYKGVVSQSQIDRANAAIKYLNGPKTAETQAVTDMIRQGRIPEALQQIEKLRQQNTGTFNPTSVGGPTSAAGMRLSAAKERTLNDISRLYMTEHTNPANGLSTPAPLMWGTDANGKRVLQINPNADPSQARQALVNAQPYYNQYKKQNDQEYAENNKPVQSASITGASYGNLSPDPSYGGGYRQAISAAAAANKVDPLAVQVLINRESSGRPMVTYKNSDGTTDYGIMQVNSGTKNPATYNWRDPVANINAGAAVLAAKLKAAGGDYHKAFHGYNGLKAPMSAYADPVYADYMRLKNGGGSVAPMPVGTRVTDRSGWKASPSGARYRVVSP